MLQPFDPGYGHEPFRGLCERFPAEETYPAKHFRLEWGAVFHRGRLDGSARVLVIGLAPGMLEVVLRRVIVGHAGQRMQGFLAKLGIERSYVMVNAFLYSAYGHAGCVEYQDHPGVVEYRNRWLDALLGGGRIEAVIALGARADAAWRTWKAGPSAVGIDPAYLRLPHPTQPDSMAKGDPERYAVAMEKMLKEWNDGLRLLKPAIRHPDVERPLVPYGRQLLPGEVLPIPSGDLPAGVPAWMGARDHWTHRHGDGPARKRGNLTITIPEECVDPALGEVEPEPTGRAAAQPGTGRIRNPDQRMQLVLAVLRGEGSLEDIAARAGVSPVSISRWRDEFLATAGSSAGVSTQQLARQLEELRRQVRSRDQVIAELTIANRGLHKP